LSKNGPSVGDTEAIYVGCLGQEGDPCRVKTPQSSCLQGGNVCFGSWPCKNNQSPCFDTLSSESGSVFSPRRWEPFSDGFREDCVKPRDR
jgi:hypothetical protein